MENETTDWLLNSNYHITNMTGTFNLGNLTRISKKLHVAQEKAGITRQRNWYTYLRLYGINTEYNRRRFHAIIQRVRVSPISDNNNNKVRALYYGIIKIYLKNM